MNSKSLIMPRLTPSNNEIIRMHWAKMKEHREIWGWEMIAAGANDIPKAKPGESRTARIFSYRKKLLDQDNFIGGLKILIDSMEDIRLIFSDDPEHFKFEAYQFNISDYGLKIQPHTEIILRWDDQINGYFKNLGGR